MKKRKVLKEKKIKKIRTIVSNILVKFTQYLTSNRLIITKKFLPY